MKNKLRQHPSGVSTYLFLTDSVTTIRRIFIALVKILGIRNAKLMSGSNKIENQKLYDDIIRKIAQFSELKDNWDDEDSLAPLEKTVENALVLSKWIKRFVTNWEECFQSVNIDVLPHGTILFSWYTENGENMLDIEVGTTTFSYFYPNSTDSQKPDFYLIITPIKG